jgi:hypothetical protein
MVETLRYEGLVNLSSKSFDATNAQTITKFAAAHDVPAMQLEINATLLDAASGDLPAHRLSQRLQALTRFCSPSRKLGFAKCPCRAPQPRRRRSRRASHGRKPRPIERSTLCDGWGSSMRVSSR